MHRIAEITKRLDSIANAVQEKHPHVALELDKISDHLEKTAGIPSVGDMIQVLVDKFPAFKRKVEEGRRKQKNNVEILHEFMKTLPEEDTGLEVAKPGKGFVPSRTSADDERED